MPFGNSRPIPVPRALPGWPAAGKPALTLVERAAAVAPSQRPSAATPPPPAGPMPQQAGASAEIAGASKNPTNAAPPPQIASAPNLPAGAGGVEGAGLRGAAGP